MTEGDAQFGERFVMLARKSFTLAGTTALIAVLLAFGQVVRLYREVSYVNAVAAGESPSRPPPLMAPLAPAIAALMAELVLLDRDRIPDEFRLT